MDTDIKATAPLTSTGAFKTPGNTSVGRSRVKGAYVECGASAGSVAIADGNGGTTLWTINTPTVANGGAYDIQLPGNGILFSSGPYGTVTNTASVTLFFDGG